MNRKNELTPFDMLFGKSLFDKSFLDIGLNEVIPSMRMDIKETENTYEIIMDIPGISKENIDMEIEDGYLTVSTKIEKSEEVKEEGVWIRRERYTGAQSKKIYVGDIKEEDIKAVVKDGVLSITINKPEEIKPKKVKINLE